MALGLALPLSGNAQDKSKDAVKYAQHADKDLAAQIADLRGKVAKLEAALAKGQPSATSGMGMMSGGMGGMMGGRGMGMMGGMAGQQKGAGGMASMGLMGMEGMMGGGMGGQGGMAGMGGQGMPGMGMMDDSMEMMGMMGMGSMTGPGAKGMAQMKMASALPGFPGASHIYHIGATGFFLDHPVHITLTTKQQTDLNGLKEKALLEKSTFQRKMDEAEQELWTLTASDKPDATKIDAKVREIEKLRGDQRLAFIRAVGEAAQVLTDEQRQALLGNAKPQAHQHTAPPSK
jgi:Spy/CpxP family protein refolding chaperone